MSVHILKYDYTYVLHQFMKEKMQSMQTEYEHLFSLTKKEKLNHLRDVENLNLEVRKTKVL